MVIRVHGPMGPVAPFSKGHQETLFMFPASDDIMNADSRHMTAVRNKFLQIPNMNTTA